ncbi:MAG: enolase C-terminal domain-like protein [Pseudomonadota bacterium]
MRDGHGGGPPDRRRPRGRSRLPQDLEPLRAFDGAAGTGLFRRCPHPRGGGGYLGRGIATATLAHFAASTPAKYLQSTTDLHNDNTRSTCHPPPPVRDGRLFAPDMPGLGTALDDGSLGPAVAEWCLP